VGVVHDRLAVLGGQLLIDALELIKTGGVQPVPQDDNYACYASMLTGEDEIIRWERDAVTIKNQVRGLNPWPGARTLLGDKLLKIWQVSVVRDYPAGTAWPGQVLEANGHRGVLVQTGDGILSIDELQLQGKKRMAVADFLRGYPLAVGVRLGER
jgi:methionyl-tRNA formyltransferase